MELDPRCQILIEYAKWTALSAVRLGPIKAREPVYQLLDRVAFPRVLDPSLGPISCREFNQWHQHETEELSARAKHCLPPKWAGELPIGWSAKLVNVFLKTTSYVGDLGREGLRDVLHPPLDNRLRARLVRCFREYSKIRDAVNFRAIAAISTYEEYERIINDGCRAAAEVLGCSLFEIEQLWSTDAPPKPLPRPREPA